MSNSLELKTSKLTNLLHHLSLISISSLLPSLIQLCVCSAWIKVEQLKPYHPHKEEMIKINKGKRFQQAVDAVEDFLKKKEKQGGKNR